jgi:DNA polymerase III epsilon subunit-like protein
LYAGLDIDYFPFINIADVAAQARSFDIKFLKAASLDYRHPAFFSLCHIYEHFS